MSSLICLKIQFFYFCVQQRRPICVFLRLKGKPQWDFLVFSLHSPFSLSFSITPFPQEQTWDWVCIGASPASICLTSGPASLHPPREGRADQGEGRNGGRSAGAKERSVFLSQRIGLCLSKSGSENVTAGETEQRHPLSVCVFVCLHGPCWAEVSYMWRSQLHASGNQGWRSKSLKCQRQLCCDMLCE